MAELNNTKLLEAISVMKESKTPESQQAVLEEIVMNAQFMIPAEVSKISEEEAKTLPNPQHNTRIKFAMITNDKRQTFSRHLRALTNYISGTRDIKVIQLIFLLMITL